MAIHMGVAARAARSAGWLGAIAGLLLLLPGPAVAEEPCQGKRGLDPRTARLQVLDFQASRGGIVGRVRNTGSDTALGVGVWVNYYQTRRGGILGQQCIPVGDLRSGEERAFRALPMADADRAEAFDFAVDAVGWR